MIQLTIWGRSGLFEMAKKMKIPILFVLAGGYQPLQDLVPLHVNTFKAAHAVYFA